MANFGERFRVAPGSRPSLLAIDPDGEPGLHKRDALPLIRDYAERLRKLQYLLFAESRRGLLICLQAMDAGGKDGTIRHVLGYMNPQGCRVHAFRKPTPEERAHDFLWRAHRHVPALGEVVIFNRSHYEDVLVTRVHGWIDEKECRRRYRAIGDFERQLSESGVHILKFYLHISEEEQLRRFARRLDDPNRWWKISEDDFRERAYWPAYRQAFESMFEACSFAHAPWFIVPANRKWYRNLVVSRIVVEYLEALDMQFPEPAADIDALRRKYCMCTQP